MAVNFILHQKSTDSACSVSHTQAFIMFPSYHQNTSWVLFLPSVKLFFLVFVSVCSKGRKDGYLQ